DDDTHVPQIDLHSEPVAPRDEPTPELCAENSDCGHRLGAAAELDAGAELGVGAVLGTGLGSTAACSGEHRAQPAVDQPEPTDLHHSEQDESAGGRIEVDEHVRAADPGGDEADQK